MRRRGVLWLLIAATLLCPSASGAEPSVVHSAKSGAWSNPEVWDGSRVPTEGDRVLIRADHDIDYDVKSPKVIRLVQVAGRLEFSREHDTELNVGLLKIVDSENLNEEGFDCHATAHSLPATTRRAEFIVGTATSPIPADHQALIRLHYVDGMDKESCPAIVCCGGRMEFHGAPLGDTWVKLGINASRGADRVFVDGSLDGWKAGDRIVITSTRHRGDGEVSQTEQRLVRAIGERAEQPATESLSPTYRVRLPNDQPDSSETPGRLVSKMAAGRGVRGVISNGQTLLLDEALAFPHDGHGDYRGEVANLSRNVVVESADPDGVRGHTMYHRHSRGSISYAEFRHLGKRGILGRYSVHFHLVGDTMRGSFVKGASIWDSDNRWVVVHGTNYLVVSDCVGFGSVGHGYFLEDGTEVFNVFDRNLAVRATEGEPLPKQVMPFDHNRGAGFWWANCHNVFANNVAADCDEYGFRFDVMRTEDFDPKLEVLQPDGTYKACDVRTMPFISFRNNEAHAIQMFGISLRGFSREEATRKMYAEINLRLAQEVREAPVDVRYPFWVQNFHSWETTFGYHAGTDGVFIDGLKVGRAGYGMWRVVLDRNAWRGVEITDVGSKQLHMPSTLGPLDDDLTKAQGRLVAIQGFTDDFAPHTVITKVVRAKNEVLVCGCSYDTSPIRHVRVNGRKAYSTRGNFAEWEVIFGVPAGEPFTASAHAIDRLGNVEPRPHVVPLQASAPIPAR
ncbi:MAG: G8 domain-containing protein [Pirellulales bacterium]